ncbi:helix-turn-helix domain-containing protein [Qaidamihabitans albus]|uniref:helix-turn-helix domain-containing protein n=1 Tax=Qaidamihabitans albus TaxID=2795733 RepID=UPI0018F247AF|nr:helix-turn-helix transcriptional regulator [Qaidamihabitans albus]
MHSVVELAALPGCTVSGVRCRGEEAGWSGPEPRGEYGVVLVRRGRFRKRCRGVVTDVDPALGYVMVPGDEEEFAHPAGGDVCTSVRLAPWLWRAMAGERARPDRPAVYVDARLELAHRRFLAAAGDAEFALAEELLGLLALAVRQVVEGPLPDGARARDGTLVAAAREAIAAGHPAARGVFPLAELLGVSPYRLSRAFPRQLGVSLTRYRNRVRVGAVIERLSAGETNLAALAANLGFADQAHLTRTVREHLGHTPTALRRLVSEGVSLSH